MRIFLTGASGFIGGHILRALSDRGHTVTCLARGAAARRLGAMALPGVSVVQGEFTRPEEWLEHVPGHDAVVNAVGIIRETPHGTFESVHQDAPIALFERAAEAGVGRIVQISALGADDEAEGRYHLSKRAADRRLAELGVPYVVLRPSVVYGPGDQSMTFFLSLAALPVTPVPGDGRSVLQPVHVDDVVRAVVVSLEREEPRALTVDVGGRDPLTLDQIFDTLARWLGKAGAVKLHAPWPLMGLAAAATDALGGRGPITGEELGMLRRGNAAYNGTFISTFGFEPIPFDVGMARKPRSEETRWHARLSQLRIPLRLTVAFIWIATGIVSAFLYSPVESLAMLERVGLTGALATVTLYATSFFEIALGLATAAGWRVRLMGAIQLLLTAAFTAILTVTMPELWLHPFGPLTKNVPLVGATLAMLALEED